MVHSSVDETPCVIVRFAVGAQQGQGAAPQPFLAGTCFCGDGRALCLSHLSEAMNLMASLLTSVRWRPSKLTRPANQCALRRRKAPRSHVFFFRDLGAAEIVLTDQVILKFAD
jgi:hypothetical protein